jgi:H+/Cl- antiporter ClcA
MGLNEDIIVDALSGKHVPVFSFLVKSFALAVTLGCGGSGGMLMPTMFVGAAAGAAVAQLFGLDPAITSAIGFVALLAGATNTPIASTILAMELFGAPIAPFAGIACCGAYIVAGHRSLYSGQKMLRPKADLFVHKKNEEGEDEIVNRFEDIPYSKLIRFQLREAKKKIKEAIKGKDER